MLAIPTVRLPARDWTRLMRLAFESDGEWHPFSSFLRNEVHRAIVLGDEECANDIVCLNSWVTYLVDWGPREKRLLVHPEDYQSSSLHLSVLSPVGTALIGIRVGDRMPFVGRADNLHVVTPVEVRQEPSAIGFLASVRKQRAAPE